MLLHLRLKKKYVKRRKNESRTVSAQIPLDIVARTVPEAERYGLSIQQHTTMIAAFINASNANIEDFALSARTVWCDRKRATQKIFDRAKETLMQE